MIWFISVLCELNHFFSVIPFASSLCSIQKKMRKKWFICDRHEGCVFFLSVDVLLNDYIFLFTHNEYWIDCDPLGLHLDNDHYKNYNNNLWSDTHITHITHMRVRRAIEMIFFHAHQLIIKLIKTPFQTENEVFILFKCN